MTGCKCKTGCYHQLTQAQAFAHIRKFREMDKSEKDLYIMGTLVSSSNDSTNTRGEEKENRSTILTILMVKLFVEKCIIDHI